MLTALIVAVCFAAGRAQEPPINPTAEAVFRKYGDLADFPPMMRDSLATFVSVESAYSNKEYAGAKQILDRFWEQYPYATVNWQRAYGVHAATSRSTGINIGVPSCYYALRMYDECLRWRAAHPNPPAPVATATLTVVLVGNSEGIAPSNQLELAAGEGRLTHNRLDPTLARNAAPILHDSLELFSEYILAASQGKLLVKTDIVRLDELTVPVSVSGRFAGLSGNATATIWNALPPSVVDKADWWWIVYPSNVPEQYPDFTTSEFITGGMGTGPDGGSPCFISDDRWLMRKPPHLGKSPYTEIERRAYLPQWLQHEMAHHWFRTWPEFGLERNDHQWFDRSTWPEDFVGFIEPDYYASALQNLIQHQADPPMHVALLYAKPSVEILRSIKVSDIMGKYEHSPRENDWHSGAIVSENGQLYWTNEAGVRWKLTLDTDRGRLTTESDCPYHNADAGYAPAHSLVLERDENGRHLPRLRGFSFQGGFFKKLPD